MLHLSVNIHLRLNIILVHGQLLELKVGVKFQVFNRIRQALRNSRRRIVAGFNTLSKFPETLMVR